VMNADRFDVEKLQKYLVRVKELARDVPVMSTDLGRAFARSLQNAMLDLVEINDTRLEDGL